MFLDQLSRDQLLDRLELALEGANLGVWDWDLTNDSVQFDRRWCEMLGLDHASTPQQLDTWRSRVHPDDLDSCYRAIHAHLEGKIDRYECVHRIRHANGEWRSILDRGRISARDEQGKPTRFTGTHLDVTASVQAHLRELFENRLASLGLAAGGIAHELNSPLQTLTLAAEELKEELAVASPDPAALKLLADTIFATTRRAAELTNALRTLSRGGDEPVPCSPVEDVLRDVEALTKQRFTATSRTLSVTVDRPCVRVCGRASELAHVLLNLVNNACDAIGDAAGWVKLEAVVDGDKVRVRCIDSGAGISVVDAGRVMEPFFTTKGIGGTGLGLSISQHLARKNRATLVHVPEAPHTTFELTLEIAP